MKKYLLLAIVPIFIQGALYSANFADVNKAIRPQLISAKTIMKGANIPLELPSILFSLLSYVEKKRISNIDAIDKIKSIKAALEEYKNQQYTRFWSRYFGSTPDKVRNEIQPAIDMVDKALEALKAHEKNYSYIMGGASILAVSALLGLTYLFSSNNSSGNNKPTQRTMIMLVREDGSLVEQVDPNYSSDDALALREHYLPSIRVPEEDRALRAQLYDKAVASGINENHAGAIERYIHGKMLELRKY